MSGSLAIQKDCGNGLVTLTHLIYDRSTGLYEAPSASTYDVGTGRLLSTVGTNVERVGRLGVERYEPMDSKAPGNNRPRVFDLTTGIAVAVIGRFPDDEGHVGSIAWDDPSIRFTAMNQTIRDGLRRGGVTLYRTKGELFEPVESVVITDWDLGFDRIIGNPAGQFFAAQYSSNRRAYFHTLTKELKPTKLQLGRVSDVSDRGVLGKEVLKELEAGYTQDGPIGCWNPLTGERLWLTNYDGSRALWLDGYALVGDEVLHATTGKVFVSLPKDRMFVAARGDTIWLITNETPRSLEVWRLSAATAPPAANRSSR